MSVQQEGLKRREALIRQCTGHEFSWSVSRRVGQALQPIIAAESAVLRERPELYILPPDATLEVPPTLEGYAQDAIKAEWDKTRKRFQDSDRFTTITADSQKQTHTWMKFDTYLPLLRAQCATLHCLQVDGVHLPLRISVNRGEATILPKTNEIPDDLFVGLVATLSRAFDDEHVDAMTDDELKARIAREHAFTEGQEVLPLHLLLNDPDRFCDLIDGRHFSVSPNRLMTEEETAAWSHMAAEVIQATRQGRDVMVGEKGWGSYQRVRGEVNLATGLTLHTNFLHPDDTESSIQTTEFLTPVEVEKRVLGTSVCKLTSIPTHGELRVELDHAATDLHYFNQWKKRRELSEE